MSVSFKVKNLNQNQSILFNTQTNKYIFVLVETLLKHLNPRRSAILGHVDFGSSPGNFITTQQNKLFSHLIVSSAGNFYKDFVTY